VRERDRERQRQRETETETERKTERQRERNRDRDRDRDRERDRENTTNILFSNKSQCVSQNNLEILIVLHHTPPGITLVYHIAIPKSQVCSRTVLLLSVLTNE
jgi:Ni/Co efflux regulator RcnB